MAKPLGPKAKLIREAITTHPDFGNTELAEAINGNDARKQDKISVKASDVFLAVAAYQGLADACDYPLHLGVTEAGALRMGTVKSSIGIGSLLWAGIGDTIRVSLSADPVEEIKVGYDILKGLGLRRRGVTVVACPSCARQNFDVIKTVDIIEQVMSNAAIEKIDPLGRKADSNNSLLAIWIANGLASSFGGMTNLDGLAKSSTNKMAGAVTKMSCLFVAAVLGAVLAYPHLLTYLPEFSLAILMIFTGWKMIAGLYHVAHHGKYAFALAMLCGILVFRLGIFEGLLISLALHSFITYVVYRAERLPTVAILKKFLEVFTDRKGHPHQSETLDVIEDAVSGGTRYVSVVRPSTAHKTLDDFIKDWAHGVDSHNTLAVVGTYDVTGLLWGTFAKDLRAGHFHIKRYFEHLFELDDVKVRFDSGETRQYGEIYIRSGSYTFTYRKRGALVQVPARYSFVCKREKTGWYILEHHSSEFPS